MSGNRARLENIHQPLKTPEPHSASTVWGINYPSKTLTKEKTHKKTENPKILRSFNYFFADFWHLLKSCKNQSPMVRAFFFEKFLKFFSRIVDPFEKHENPPPPHPLGNPDPWDHAQMIERKILCRIALTRALYDQIRP